MCQRCRERAAGWLAQLPDLWRRLELAEVPGQQAAGPRVSASGPQSRPPANVDALSLRVASTQRLAASRVGPAGWTPDEADLPIPAWADGWVRAWRLRNDHHRPGPKIVAPRTELPGHIHRPVPPTPPARQGGKQAYTAALLEYNRQVRAYNQQLELWNAWRRRGAQVDQRVALGVGPAQPVLARPDDPLAERHMYAYGRAPAAFKLGADCGYLTTWLPAVCDNPARHPDLRGFLAGLRALHRRAQAVLGETVDDWYLGRCPEPRLDRATGAERPCGARLFQDPFLAMNTCPRCGKDTPQKEWPWLAMRSRELFPDDAPDRSTIEEALLPSPPPADPHHPEEPQ